MNIRDQIAIIQRERTQQFIRPYYQTATEVYLLEMGSGNVINVFGGNTYYGSKGSGAAVVTAVPTAAPATLSDATVDGLSAALLTNMSGATSLVWASGYMNPGTGAVTGLAVTIADGTPFISYRIVNLPVTAAPGTTAPVYLITAIA